MSNLTNQMTFVVGGLRGPGLSPTDLATIEGATDNAVRSAGFDTLAAATTFAPRIVTGARTSVRDTDTANHPAVVGEVRLDGTAATLNEAIPNEGRYTKQASGALWRTGSSDRQLAAIQAAIALNAAAQVAVVNQTFGRPAASPPVAGTIITDNDVRVFNIAAASDTSSKAMRVNAAKKGAVRISAWLRSGSTWAMARSKRIKVEAGQNLLNVLSGLDLSAGEWFGIDGGGVLQTTTTAGDSGGYYSGMPNSSGVFTDSSVFTGARVEFGIDFQAMTPDALIDSRLDRLESQGGSSYTLGKYGVPTTMAGTAQDRVYALGPMVGDGVFDKARVYAKVPGPWYFRAGAKAGDNFAPTDNHMVRIDMVAGDNEISVSDFLLVRDSEFLEFYPYPGSMAAGADYESSWFGYFDNAAAGGGRRWTFTDAAISTYNTTTLQVGFDFRTFPPGTFDAKLAALTGNAGKNAYANVQPDGWILVWVDAQSNGAGRAQGTSEYVFFDGQAYKYVRSAWNPLSPADSLQRMADPTGNDAGATTAPVRGSAGPAIAAAVRELSGGRIGVILVNSSEGSTSITSNWGDGQAVWNQAKTDLANAKVAAAAAGKAIVGTAVWAGALGETDAAANMSKTTFKNAGADLFTRIRAEIGAQVPIILTRIGVPSTGDTTGFQNIRAAQEELAQEQINVHMVHTRARYFNTTDMIETYHYAMRHYDEIGWAVGVAALQLGFGVRPLGYAG